MKALEQVEAWDEVAADAAYVAALPQALGGIVYAQAVVSELPTSWEPPAFRKHAQSAGLV